MVLISLLVRISVHGQVQISGHIITSDSLAVSFASVSLISPADSSVIAYTTSAADGSFILIADADANLRQLLIKCTHIAKGQYKALIKNESQSLLITLDGKPIQMPEVKVDAPLVEVHGDTISYRLEAFATPKDRTLADVLSKLPGVEVDANGAIKYQGEYIKKFYVEGKDLMELRYGVITNAMPNVDVETVDILKNHQPIRMLENKVPSAGTAFNIRLKKAISFSGSGDVALGAAPFIWSGRLTPMVFTKDVQTLVDLKSNNTGEDPLASYNTITIGGGGFVSDISRPIRSGETLHTNRPQPPDLKTSTYLDNRSHLFSANALKELLREWEIKFNLDGWHHRIQDMGRQDTRIVLDSGNRQDSLFYTEAIDNALADQNIRGSIFASQNGKTSFLKDHLSFQLNRKVRDNQTDLNSSKLLQEITSPSLAMQNSLVGIKVLGPQKEHHLNYKSYFNYLHEDYNYSLQSAQPFLIPQLGIQTTETLLQLLEQRALETSHEASMRFFYRKWELEPKVELRTSRSELYSDLLNANDAISQNRSETHRVQTSGSLHTALKLRRFNFSLSLPLDIAHVNIRTKTLETRKTRLFIQPRLAAYWRLSTFSEWVVSSFLRQSFGNIDRVYEHIVMNATSFSTYPPDLSTQQITSITSQWKYGNPLNNISAYLSVNRMDTHKDFIYAQTVMENGQRSYELVPRSNKREFTSINPNFGKYFYNIRTNIILNGTYSLTRSNSLVQGQLTDNKINNLTFSTKIIYNQLNWIGLQYEINLGTTNSHRIGTSTNYTEENHQFNCFVYPLRHHLLNLNLDYYRFKYPGADNRYPFLSLAYRFALST